MRISETKWPYLVVGREFHGGDAVDVFFDLGEKIVPATDQATLVLVVDQLQLVRTPRLVHLTARKTEAKAEPGSGQGRT